jgi:hypothetical protein
MQTITIINTDATIANVSAYILENIAAEIFAATPACIKTMAKVATDLEVARLAFRSGDEDATIDAIDRAAAAVWPRCHSRYRAVMATFA